MIELIFHKELMLIEQTHQKNMVFDLKTKILVLNMRHIFAMVVMI